MSVSWPKTTTKVLHHLELVNGAELDDLLHGRIGVGHCPRPEPHTFVKLAEHLGFTGPRPADAAVNLRGSGIAGAAAAEDPNLYYLDGLNLFWAAHAETYPLPDALQPDEELAGRRAIRRKGPFGGVQASFLDRS